LFIRLYLSVSSQANFDSDIPLPQRDTRLSDILKKYQVQSALNFQFIVSSVQRQDGISRGCITLVHITEAS